MNFHRLILGSMGNNCYIAADEDTKNAVMFDAPDNSDIIISFLEENGYNLKKILLTHGHYDHILALSDLKRATKAEICIHEMDKEFLEDCNLNLANQMFAVYKKATADTILKDGDIIKCDSMEIKVIHTPGHTEGCVCYYMENEGILISGDTLFYHSIGRTDMIKGDYDSEINSIINKLMPLDDDIKVYPGHGMETTIGNERKENPYLR